MEGSPDATQKPDVPKKSLPGWWGEKSKPDLATQMLEWLKLVMEFPSPREILGYSHPKVIPLKELKIQAL